MALTPQRFIDALRDFGLLEPEDLNVVQSELSCAAPTFDTSALSAGLVKAGKLTSFQAEIIIEGSANSLVYGEYIVLDKLGAGGMGRVFKARHRRMKRLVALKVLPGEAMQDPSAVMRFQREVEAAATLSHPNIVTAFDAGEANGVHFLAMEYVEGRDLLAIARERGMLPLAQTLNYITQAARGLAYAHARGVIHRDIKPANLLLDSHGTVKVLDMGVARFMHSAGPSTQEITVSGEMMGSADYMAPEQATDVRQADARADVYSLGFSLYRLLTGAIPYSGESFVQKVLAHREQPAPSMSARRPDVTPALEAVYLRMVAKGPEDRYRDMTEVIAALNECLAALPPAPALPAPLAPTSTPEDETLSRSMFQRQKDVLLDSEVNTSRSLVKIELDDRSMPGTAWAGPAAGRRRKAVPAIAGATILSIVVVASVAFFKNDPRPPDQAGQVTSSAGRSASFVDSSVRSRTPGPETAPGDTAPVVPLTTMASQPAPAQTLPSADRRVAEWVIGLRGQVGVRPPDSNVTPLWVPAVAYLPSEDYRVCRIMIYQIKGTNVSDQDLEGLRELTELEDLNLGGCVTWVTNRGLQALGQIASLQRIDLDGANITDQGISCLRPLTALRVLSLASTGITDHGLDSFRTMHLLERLYLDHTAVTDAVCVMAETYWPLLSELSLPDGAVTDLGLSSLASLKHLKSLLLSQTPISNDQLRLLADLKALRSLKLDSTRINDAGLANLLALNSLTSLSIRDTNLTPAAIASLRQAFPKCKIDAGR